MERREAIKALALGTPAMLTGLSRCSAEKIGHTNSDPSTPALSDSDDWQLVFEDEFTGGSLDRSKWDTGWGWGHKSSNTAGDASAENVSVSDSRLKLKVTKGEEDLPYLVGAVNTKDKFTFGPGTYLEARVKALNLPGCNQAFWSKPNSEEWPPEIDFFEIPTKQMDRSIHNIHYSESIKVGDRSTHATHHNATYFLDTGEYSDNFHVFGCAWHSDRIEHYLDGEQIGTTEDPKVVTAVNRGAPFYLMFTTAIDQDWLGVPPEDWSGYHTVMEIAYVRAWEYALH